MCLPADVGLRAVEGSQIPANLGRTGLLYSTPLPPVVLSFLVKFVGLQPHATKDPLDESERGE